MIVRRAREEDALAISRVRVATWLSTYRGMMPDSMLDSLDAEKGAEGWRKAARSPETGLWVAETDEEGVIGFACSGKKREETAPGDGKVYAIYVLKEKQGKGAGRELLRSSFSWLREQGHSSCVIWVLTENHASRNFYESMGGKLEVEKQALTFAGFSLEHSAYVWKF